MSIARAIYVSVMRLFQAIIAFFRSLCSGNRNKKRMEMDDVPFEVVVDGGRGDKREERASLLQNAAMDSWDDADWDKKEEVNDKIEQWRNTNAQKPEPQHNPDDDLFSTLEPTITSARKVVVVPRGARRESANSAKNRFEVNETTIGASTTLGEIDDDLLGWGDDDLDSTLKEHKEEQRKQLQLEHERRLQQKKMQNATTHIL